MTEQQTDQTAQTYAPGTPIWMDVNAPDAAAARAFYSGLFGWQVYVTDDPTYGGYGMFFHDGKQVAGVGPTMDPNQPATWSTYMLTENADETAEAVKAAGGQEIVPPMQVGPNGRMAIFTDPTGAFFGIWEPGDHKGADLFNQPVSVIWDELQTRDVDAATAFYGAVFGYEPVGAGDQVMYQVGGATVASATRMGEQTPEFVPSHWRVYFCVNDARETAARARELGGTVLEEPHREQWGMFALLQDPQGAVFGIMSAE